MRALLLSPLVAALALAACPPPADGSVACLKTRANTPSTEWRRVE